MADVCHIAQLNILKGKFDHLHQDNYLHVSCQLIFEAKQKHILAEIF